MFSNIHHVAFVVRDMDRAVSRFERVSGLELATVERMTGTFDLEVALFAVGETLVEFITPTTEEGWVRDHLDEHGEGLFHVAFEVDDIEESIRQLEDQGYTFADDAPRQGLDWLVATMDESETPFPMQLVEDSRTRAERIGRTT